MAQKSHNNLTWNNKENGTALSGRCRSCAWPSPDPKGPGECR